MKSKTTILRSLALVFLAIVFNTSVRAATESSVSTNVTSTSSNKSVTITYNSKAKIFTVNRVYQLDVSQNPNTNYDHAILRVPYKELASALGGVSYSAWTFDNTKTMLYYPSDSKGNWSTHGDNWYDANGILSSWSNANSRFFIQHCPEDEKESGNFIIWTGQHADASKASKNGTTYKATFYMVNGSNGVEFDLALKIVGNGYPASISQSELNIVGTKDIEIKDYPRNDNYRGHLRTGFECDDVPTLLYKDINAFTTSMLYAASSATTLTNVKTASESAGASNTGFWFSNGNAGYCFAQSYSSESRVYISRLRYNSDKTIDIMWGQYPNNCSKGNYNTTCYLVNDEKVNGKYLAYQVNVCFVLVDEPSHVDDATSYGDYPIQNVPFSDVTVSDDFWAPRITQNQSTTIPIALQQCYANGRLDNFKKAAGAMSGYFVGENTFDDTDIYKIIEGMSYSIQANYSKSLDDEMDTLIYWIGRAQEDDGYLMTARTAAEPGKMHSWLGASCLMLRLIARHVLL